MTFAVQSCSLHAQKPRFLCSAINATLVESLLYIPLLTDDIQERHALHNHENAVENFGSPMIVDEEDDVGVAPLLNNRR